ncbi:MAG: hypothetical protein AMK72_04975 [Planctomycetes bacterium SM23_25]|nr:MAG: hypothetical protein AMK72_04975 [Planctomycetes bacterium SM23_25]
MNAGNEPGGARAFTLVELVTVMGILAILVALIAGAAGSVSNLAATKATERILDSLDASLQRYFDDWGKFPWYRDETDPELIALLGPVAGYKNPAERANPSYCPIYIQGKYENDVEAMLYASLNMSERNGPYAPGGGQNVKLVPFGIFWKHRVFVDAWGRPIHYLQPQRDSRGVLKQTPLLMSEGRTADFFNHVSRQGDMWPARSKADNLTNYDLRAMGLTAIDVDDPSRRY